MGTTGRLERWEISNFCARDDARMNARASTSALDVRSAARNQ
jgi:hypothetical protein